MSEINKIGSSLVDATKPKQTLKPDVGQQGKFRDILKSAEVFSQEVDQMIQKAEADSVNGRVSNVGKTIDTLGEIVSQINPEKVAGRSVVKGIQQYEKQDLKPKS